MWDKIYVAAPEQVRWPLTLDQVEAALRSHLPTATVARQHAVVGDHDYLSFVVPADDQDRHGLYIEPGNLTLLYGSPTDWAPTSEWFLTLLPAGPAAIALVESNTANPIPVPDGATADQIRDLLDRLIAA